jgi:hypothetical protein
MAQNGDQTNLRQEEGTPLKEIVQYGPTVISHCLIKSLLKSTFTLNCLYTATSPPPPQGPGHQSLLECHA